LGNSPNAKRQKPNFWSLGVAVGNWEKTPRFKSPLRPRRKIPKSARLFPSFSK
jgi:hypothetical protein